MKKFEFLEHTADIKFKAYGKSLEEVFENSAKAIINSVTDGKIKKKKIEKIKINSNSLEGLMYGFLEEIIFFIETKGIVFAGVKEIKIDKKNFKVSGEFFFDNVNNYEFHLDAKAITHNEMFLKNEKGKWIAQVVVDV